MKIKVEDIILNKVITDLSQTIMLIDGLQILGYNKCFELYDTKLRCRESKKSYSQVDLLVDEIFSIEDATISNLEFKIYALSHRNENLKGIFMAI